MNLTFGDENTTPKSIKKMNQLERENRSLRSRLREEQLNKRVLARELKEHNESNEDLAEQVHKLRSASSKLGARLGILCTEQSSALKGSNPHLEEAHGGIARQLNQHGESRRQADLEALMQAEATVIIRTAHLRALREQNRIALEVIGAARRPVTTTKPLPERVDSDILRQISMLTSAAEIEVTRVDASNRVLELQDKASNSEVRWLSRLVTIKALSEAKLQDKRRRLLESRHHTQELTESLLTLKTQLDCARSERDEAMRQLERSDAQKTKAETALLVSSLVSSALFRALWNEDRANKEGIERIQHDTALQNKQLEKQVDHFRQAFHSVREELGSAFRSTGQKAAALAAVEDELQTLRADYENKVAEADRARQDLEGVREQAKAASKAEAIRSARLENENVRMAAALKASDAAAIDLENQLSSAERKLRDLSTVNDITMAELNEHRMEMLKLRQLLEAREWRVEDLLLQIDDAWTEAPAISKEAKLPTNEPTDTATRGPLMSPEGRAQIRRLLREREALIKSMAQLQAALAAQSRSG